MSRRGQPGANIGISEPTHPATANIAIKTTATVNSFSDRSISRERAAWRDGRRSGP
jgi:hypothetical protein